MPFFNEDVEATGDPEPVRRFKDAIATSNAVLLATPEYNGVVPGLPVGRGGGPLVPTRPARRACQHAVGDCSVGYLASGWLTLLVSLVCL